ncbi:MAG: hypothetical protein GTO40_16155 [Deltaproteobacteria bacterium]|nr:hypothetical protein [Deltaproteobacteria bacterium]
MAETVKAKVGFVSPVSGASPHIESFKLLVPDGVQMDIDGLELIRDSFYDFRGKTQAVVDRVKELVRANEWQGVFVGGAPLELMNPGLAEALHRGINVPSTTALESCVTALKAFSAKQFLLMTPFDDSMNQRIKDYLAVEGLTAISPNSPFKSHRDAGKLTPEEVLSLTRRSLEGVTEIQAIYFQGGVLDPLEVVKEIEGESSKPVVASNPAMLWHILSRLGFKCSVPGRGRLMEEWPALPLQG